MTIKEVELGTQQLLVKTEVICSQLEIEKVYNRIAIFK